MINSKILIVLIIIVLQGCNDNIKQARAITLNHFNEHKRDFENLIIELDNDSSKINLWGCGIAFDETNFKYQHKYDFLFIDSIWFHTGGCNMRTKMKQYFFVCKRKSFRFGYSRNLCDTIYNKLGFFDDESQKGIITEGLGSFWSTSYQ